MDRWNEFEKLYVILIINLLGVLINTSYEVSNSIHWIYESENKFKFFFLEKKIIKKEIFIISWWSIMYVHTFEDMSSMS